MTKARDIADFKFENIVDTGNTGTKVASGTTAQRGATAGQFRFNTTNSVAEYYDGTAFRVLDTPPTVSSISPTTIADSNSSVDIVITGTNFASGANVKAIGQDASEITATTVTVNSTTQITANFNGTSFLNAQEDYDIKVISLSSLSGVLEDALSVNASPSWTTASGQIGSSTFETKSFSTTVAATDPESGTITYSLASGSLPSGITLNTSSGVVSGTAPSVSSDTTFNFTLGASDGTNTSNRAFNIIIKNDTLVDGLVGWWQTANTTDSSGNNYNGTVAGSNSSSVTTVTDSGTPLGSRTVTSFPDSDGYINLPTSTVILGTNSRTITTWYKPAGTTDSSDYLFGFGSDSVCNGATFNARNGGQKMGFMGCAQDFDNNGSVVYSSGTWVRVFYTFDGTTLGAYYLDGSGNRQTAWTTSSLSLNTSIASGGVAGIGRHASATSGDITGANGRMCDFRIYNRVLTEAEMEELYNR